jgi:hypothetical protein
VFAKTEFKTTVMHNQEGFRDIHHEKKNTKNRFRIITLGDSFTWGHGVNNDEIYMKVLEQYDKQIETINMGGPGSDPPGELTVYQRRGVAYEHDVVLLGFFMGNDVVSYHARPQDSPPRWGYNQKGEFTLIGSVRSQEDVERIRQRSQAHQSDHDSLIQHLENFVIRHFQSYTFLGNIQSHFATRLQGSIVYTRLLQLLGLDYKKAYGFLNYCLEEDPEDVKFGWKLLKDTLLKMKQFAAQADADLYIVFIPHIIQTSKTIYATTVRRLGHDPDHYDIEKPNRKLKLLCASLQIDCLDLLPVFKRETAQGKVLYYPRDAHWTAEGHRLAAREIYDDLKQKGWLDKSY